MNTAALNSRPLNAGAALSPSPPPALAPGDLRAGVTFSGVTGTLVVPDPADVRAGVAFGAGGGLTGELAASGGGLTTEQDRLLRELRASRVGKFSTDGEGVTTFFDADGSTPLFATPAPAGLTPAFGGVARL